MSANVNKKRGAHVRLCVCKHVLGCLFKPLSCQQWSSIASECLFFLSGIFCLVRMSVLNSSCIGFTSEMEVILDYSGLLGDPQTNKWWTTQPLSQNNTTLSLMKTQLNNRQVETEFSHMSRGPRTYSNFPKHINASSHLQIHSQAIIKTLLKYPQGCYITLYTLDYYIEGN